MSTQVPGGVRLALGDRLLWGAFEGDSADVVSGFGADVDGPVGDSSLDNRTAERAV